MEDAVNFFHDAEYLETDLFLEDKSIIEARSIPFKTLETIELNYFKHFSKTTAVNCNSIYKKSHDWLENKIMESDKYSLDPIPDSVYEEIIEGVLLSPLIEEDVKDIFREKPE